MEKTFTSLLRDCRSPVAQPTAWASSRRLPPLPQRPLLRLVGAVAPAGHGFGVLSRVLHPCIGWGTGAAVACWRPSC